MMLTERSPIPVAALPIEAFRAHLRLGRGFSSDTLQDTLLEGFLRAAYAAIESRTGKTLIIRAFQLDLVHWSSHGAQTLPVAPVAAVDRIAQVDAFGAETAVAPNRYALRPDTQHPQIVARAGALPNPPKGGLIRIDLQAGMAATHADLPADLAQAVMMLATHFYEHREDTGLHRGCMPFGVTSLIERYRTLRLRLGDTS